MFRTLIFSLFLVVNAAHAVSDDLGHFKPSRICAIAVVNGFTGQGFVQFSYANSYLIAFDREDGHSRPDNFLEQERWPWRSRVFHNRPFGEVLAALRDERARNQTLHLYRAAINGSLGSPQRRIALDELETNLTDPTEGDANFIFLRNTLYGHFDWQEEILLRAYVLPVINEPGRFPFPPRTAQLINDLVAHQDATLRGYHSFLSVDGELFAPCKPILVPRKSLYHREIAERGFFWNLAHRPDRNWVNEIKDDPYLSGLFTHHGLIVDRIVATYDNAEISNEALSNYYRLAR